VIKRRNSQSKFEIGAKQKKDKDLFCRDNNNAEGATYRMKKTGTADDAYIRVGIATSSTE